MANRITFESAGSQAVLRAMFADAILAGHEDASVFGLNAFSNGRMSCCRGRRGA